jgi:hypothetical protein
MVFSLPFGHLISVPGHDLAFSPYSWYTDTWMTWNISDRRAMSIMLVAQNIYSSFIIVKTVLCLLIKILYYYIYEEIIV